ncbi:3-ketoacyl-CoA reductase [Collybia nuda]|uniref:3-ketoacyl-CoA reductase n=1 Tax=Collybia nuda TaxID=64659 RepID=A0A9P5XXJ7_9AGAR|nr:3-ketoacyl-CoA reductase [Collybia nuda]
MDSLVKNFHFSLAMDSKWDCLLWFLLFVGLFKSLGFLWRTGLVIAQTFLIPGKSLSLFGVKSAWAVVTGASDGIGREFALQLGAAGFNVVLMARNESALKELATEIEQKSGVSTKIHLIDFTKTNEDSYAAITEQLSSLDIGVLVNNVGCGHSISADFVDVSQQEFGDIVAVNVTANVRVTRVILPMMIKRSAKSVKNRGLIINVGSFSGAVPIPMLQTYSATKAFLATFSTALAEEVRQHRITVEHLNAYFIVTKLSKISRTSLFVPTAKPYVAAVLSKIGLACGAAYTGRPNTSSPFWGHAVLDWYINSFPGGPSSFIETSFRMQRGLRASRLRKLEREKNAQH